MDVARTGEHESPGSAGKWVDGRAQWMIDGDKELGAWGSGASAVKRDGSKALGIAFADLQIHEIHPASYDVHERVAYMDEQGISGADCLS